jgi:hypothetical protein
LIRQLSIGETLPCDLRHDLNEAARVIAIFAMVEAKDLLGHISVKVDWFD